MCGGCRPGFRRPSCRSDCRSEATRLPHFHLEVPPEPWSRLTSVLWPSFGGVRIGLGLETAKSESSLSQLREWIALRAMHDVFISYAREDHALAKKLAEAL